MGWKPAQQHGRRDMSHERENLPAQEHIPLGNNKRRNALTVCSLREDVLRQVDNLCARHNQGNQRQLGQNEEMDAAK